MKKLISAAMVTLLSFSLVALSGCNTFRGAGQDISNTGKAIQKASH